MRSIAPGALCIGGFFWAHDFCTTDCGLLSAGVIATTPGMGGFFARDMARHMRADGEAADRAAKGP